MTLQQLKYAVTVADKGSISEAAKALFLSQPSLTRAIQELEGEMQLVLFSRTNRGMAVTKEGDEFLAYARQVLTQASLLEEKYLHGSAQPSRFSVSAQHYSFAVNAENPLTLTITEQAGTSGSWLYDETRYTVKLYCEKAAATGVYVWKAVAEDGKTPQSAFSFTNTYLVVLPNTGGAGRGPFLLAGALLMALAVSAGVYQHKRRS